jgi:hypothetical protein
MVREVASNSFHDSPVSESESPAGQRHQQLIRSETPVVRWRAPSLPGIPESSGRRCVPDGRNRLPFRQSRDSPPRVPESRDPNRLTEPAFRLARSGKRFAAPEVPESRRPECLPAPEIRQTRRTTRLPTPENPESRHRRRLSMQGISEAGRRASLSGRKKRHPGRKNRKSGWTITDRSSKPGLSSGELVRRRREFLGNPKTTDHQLLDLQSPDASPAYHQPADRNRTDR